MSVHKFSCLMSVGLPPPPPVFRQTGEGKLDNPGGPQLLSVTAYVPRRRKTLNANLGGPQLVSVTAYVPRRRKTLNANLGGPQLVSVTAYVPRRRKTVNANRIHVYCILIMFSFQIFYVHVLDNLPNVVECP